VSDTNTWLFNTNQLATWDQARETAIKLSVGPVGGPGGFPEPNYTDPKTGEKYFYLHYRFQNGAEGMNVGLIMDKFRRYPNSPMYVMGALAAEAASMAR
jgi:hypothetical protein